MTAADVLFRFGLSFSPDAAEVRRGENADEKGNGI